MFKESNPNNINRQKQKPELRMLLKVLGTDDFQRVKKTFTPDEMRKHDKHLAEESWDAHYVPKLLAEARKREKLDK